MEPRHNGFSGDVFGLIRYDVPRKMYGKPRTDAEPTGFPPPLPPPFPATAKFPAPLHSTGNRRYRAGLDGPGPELEVLLSGPVRAWIPLLCDGNVERIKALSLQRKLPELPGIFPSYSWCSPAQFLLFAFKLLESACGFPHFFGKTVGKGRDFPSLFLRFSDGLPSCA